jgi:hypothetical protein
MSARLRACLIHVIVSLLGIVTLLGLVLLFWYPAPLSDYEGAWTPLRILIVVDLVIGPLLTLLVYKPGKKGLIFDMILITLLKVGALAYGTHVLWSQRPMVMVFAVDAYYVVGAGDLAGRDIPEALWRDRPLAGPLPVYGEPITDPEYQLKVMLEGAPDMHLLPSQYRPANANMPAIHSRHSDLLALSAHRPLIAEAIAGLDPSLLSDTLALPVHGRQRSGTVLIHRETGWPVRYLDLDLAGELARMRGPARLPRQRRPQSEGEFVPHP